jgi:diacylglycerol kinase family enzyme
LSKYVEIIKSEKMVINTNIKLIHIDGEPKKFESPITIKSNPKSLKIFSPYEKR